MQKKLMLACIVVAAISALIIAPAASAATLTSEGKVIPVGTSITAKSAGNVTYTGAFGLVCDHAQFTGTVTRNNTIEPFAGRIPVGWAKINGTGTNTDCTSALGGVKFTVNSELCFEQVAGADTVRFTGCGGNATYTLEITGAGPCRYNTASLSATFTTSSNPATLNILEEPASGAGENNGFFCPASGKLDMDFDLYTTNGVGIAIS